MLTICGICRFLFVVNILLSAYCKGVVCYDDFVIVLCRYDVTVKLQCQVDISSLCPHSRRFQTMATMFAVDVLGCTGTNEERAGLLHKIIQIAAELKSTMGNMFGFAAVMRALELPQVTDRSTTNVSFEVVFYFQLRG